MEAGPNPLAIAFAWAVKGALVAALLTPPRRPSRIASGGVRIFTYVEMLQ
jgi:hypothetical protein